jgi:superfamily I DNA/RNA helicase
MSSAEARALARLLDVVKPQLKELSRYTLASFGWDARARMPWYDALPGIPADRREYYLSCLRRGEKLAQPPRVRLETVHGVKGAEADHVMLLTDMSHRTAESFRAAPDGEHRVFYVGLTRARSTLHLVMPQSDESYKI